MSELSELITLAATLRTVAESVERYLESDSERHILAEQIESLDIESGRQLRAFTRWLDDSDTPPERRADVLAIATMLRASATVAASAIGRPRRRGATQRPLPSTTRARALVAVAARIEDALREVGNPDVVLALRREVRAPWRRSGDSYGRMDHALDRSRHAGLALERLSTPAVLAWSAATEG